MSKEMKSQDGHYHARTSYRETTALDYLRLVEDLAKTKEQQGKSLNVHIPLEIQHPDIYAHKKNGLQFIRFAELAKKPFGVPLYWENAAEQIYGEWILAHGATNWASVPKNIDLTLDTGHLMMGEKTVEHAQERIRQVIYERGKQIKHLHVHENDLVHDWHWQIGNVITEEIFQEITHGRTYIFERDEIITGESPQPPYPPLTYLYERIAQT